MGRPPIGLWAMTNAQRQAHYRRTKKEKELKQTLELDTVKSELVRSNHVLECLQCQTTDNKVQSLLKQIEALKEENAELRQGKNSLAEEYRELNIEKHRLERQLRDVTIEKRKLERQLSEIQEVPSKEETSLSKPLVGRTDDINAIMKNIGRSWSDL